MKFILEKKPFFKKNIFCFFFSKGTLWARTLCDKIQRSDVFSITVCVRKSFGLALLPAVLLSLV